MNKIKLQIPHAVLEFIQRTGNLITLNNETHVYYQFPWFKAEPGSDIIEEYFTELEHPDELRKAIHGHARKGALAICSKGRIGLITSRSPVAIEYADGNKGFAWTGIHLTDAVVGDGKAGEPFWSSRDPKIVGHVDDLTGKYPEIEPVVDVT